MGLTFAHISERKNIVLTCFMRSCRAEKLNYITYQRNETKFNLTGAYIYVTGMIYVIWFTISR